MVSHHGHHRGLPSLELPGPRDPVHLRAARGRGGVDGGPRPHRGLPHAAPGQRKIPGVRWGNDGYSSGLTMVNLPN